jgi:hypothetical protein
MRWVGELDANQVKTRLEEGMRTRKVRATTSAAGLARGVKRIPISVVRSEVAQLEDVAERARRTFRRGMPSTRQAARLAIETRSSHA